MNTVISYEDWTKGTTKLLHIVNMPETGGNHAITIRIGIMINNEAPKVRIEASGKLDGLTHDFDLSKLLELSAFEDTPRMYYETRSTPHLKAAVELCSNLKARLDSYVDKLVTDDRAAFERSLQGA